MVEGFFQSLGLFNNPGDWEYLRKIVDIGENLGAISVLNDDKKTILEGFSKKMKKQIKNIYIDLETQKDFRKPYLIMVLVHQETAKCTFEKQQKPRIIEVLKRMETFLVPVSLKTAMVVLLK